MCVGRHQNNGGNRSCNTHQAVACTSTQLMTPVHTCAWCEAATTAFKKGSVPALGKPHTHLGHPSNLSLDKNLARGFSPNPWHPCSPTQGANQLPQRMLGHKHTCSLGDDVHNPPPRGGDAWLTACEPDPGCQAPGGGLVTTLPKCRPQRELGLSQMICTATKSI